MPTVDLPGIQIIEVGPEFWGAPIIRFLQNGTLPTDVEEAMRLRRKACSFTLLESQLYQRGYYVPLLKCVNLDQSVYIMAKIHEGVCGGHLGR